MSYLTPDGRARVPQLRLGGGRHRAGDRVRARDRAAASRSTIGNFWVDMTRALLWVLLPFCVVGALAPRLAGGRPELRPYDVVADARWQRSSQTIAQGPVASQEIIKQWGTNGGGFFNANSAHPFENPTPLSNFLQMFAIFAISAGLTWTLGDMTGSRRHGWAVWAAMAFLFLAGVTVAYWAEARGNPLLAGVDQQSSALQPGGNMEGKEVRFGIANSALFATVTTAASCGAVNSMHDSFTPLGGMVPLVNIMLGEVIFGGVGAGLYGMLLFVVLAVFIAGLMVGRTPEYLGKRIEAFDVKMAMLAVLISPLTILVFTGISIVSPIVRDLEPRPIQARTACRRSCTPTRPAPGTTGRRSPASRPTPLGTTPRSASRCCSGRFLIIIPMLALAGNLARKKRVPPSAGTFPGDDAALRHAAGRRDRHRRRADVLPGAQPGSDRRAAPDATAEQGL